MTGLHALAKQHGFTRIGVNAVFYDDPKSRFLCEVWGDGFKFASAYGGTQPAAINRAIKAAKKALKLANTAQADLAGEWVA